ncbi:hypothetical protein AMK59_4678, partial [Oryctes borbonicus]
MVATTIKRGIFWCTVVVVMATATHCAVLNFTDLTIRVQNIKCGEPRLKSFRITELYSNVSEYATSPSRIILYRCEEALGCCDIGEKCTMKTSTPLTIELLQGSSQEFIGREAEDHTSCHCIPDESQIK